MKIRWRRLVLALRFAQTGLPAQLKAFDWPPRQSSPPCSRCLAADLHVRRAISGRRFAEPVRCAAHVARHNLPPPFIEVWGHTPDKTLGNVPDHNAVSKKDHFHPLL
jgi:hypothetical protein